MKRFLSNLPHMEKLNRAAEWISVNIYASRHYRVISGYINYGYVQFQLRAMMALARRYTKC